MPASPKFGGPVLAKCALKGKTPLEDQKSKCVINVHLNGDFFCWEMDHDKIVKAAKKAAQEAGEPEALQRCDFAVYQDKNLDDGKSHLILVECKKTCRGNEQDMEEAYNQLVDGLRVLRYMAGEQRFFRFDILTPMYVYSREQGYRGAIMSRSMQSTLHKLQVEYNGRRARIRVRKTDVMIDDRFVAIKGIK